MKDKIIDLLLKTRRIGIENLISYMDKAGFFTAPCSTQYHLCKEGGLAEHSFHVYEVAKQTAQFVGMHPLVPSLTICTLLHDLGKCGQFGKPAYLPNLLKGRATKANPNPEPIQSTAKPYVGNPDLLYVDHEVRSIQIINRYIELTEEENWAILMHNGLYGSFKYQIQGKETPLYLILHFADMWASRVLEKEGEPNE